ncbi:hypothetical protein PGT21_005807 [Puccinia graminis f. sp. tritici]|uniref:Uncharacterized protein n=1 Tax=Puccinia graminis f. sp. tritici TaxID=56615 RepID=A0A5B0LSN4_PUCGR|nr:hypothetical protein PGT21_005807 [Puccinia graminis f. sp. tritici]KAA1137766.1 hypothetical protein PGTUg99_015367 [Puccinia graminis f. sp. tritici]
MLIPHDNSRPASDQLNTLAPSVVVSQACVNDKIIATEKEPRNLGASSSSLKIRIRLANKNPNDTTALNAQQLCPITDTQQLVQADVKPKQRRCATIAAGSRSTGHEATSLDSSPNNGSNSLTATVAPVSTAPDPNIKTVRPKKLPASQASNKPPLPTETVPIVEPSKQHPAKRGHPRKIPAMRTLVTFKPAPLNDTDCDCIQVCARANWQEHWRIRDLEEATKKMGSYNKHNSMDMVVEAKEPVLMEVEDSQPQESPGKGLRSCKRRARAVK